MNFSHLLRKLVTLAGLALVSISTVSCMYSTKQLDVTYLSYPSNAALFRGNTNQQIGMAPQTVSYMVTPEQQKEGFIMIPDVTARWVSGATASTGEIRAEVTPTSGYSQEFTLVRPADVAGVEIDATFASDHARNKIEAERNDIMVGRVTE